MLIGNFYNDNSNELWPSRFENNLWEKWNLCVSNPLQNDVTEKSAKVRGETSQHFTPREYVRSSGTFIIANWFIWIQSILSQVMEVVEISFDAIKHTKLLLFQSSSGGTRNRRKHRGGSGRGNMKYPRVRQIKLFA